MTTTLTRAAEQTGATGCAEREPAAAHQRLGFGLGPRFCLGAVLARTVAGPALDVLVRDHPRLARAGHDHDDGQPSLLSRSLTAPPVRY
jgi:cytochrome P450